jgi:tetratricopeptide (TPR) repeat protein
VRYLPLAIGMIASQLRNHPAWGCDELAADMATARDRLTVMRAENLSVAAAFDLSYADLTPGPQQLFRRLGLVPGPTIDAYAAAALDNTSLEQARRHLEELYDQHLVTEPAPGRYQMHDLVREHAHGLAAADKPAESSAAVGWLLDYYLYAAAAAGRHFSSWLGTCHQLPPGRPPADVPDLSNSELAATWLEAERPNLHAAVEHAASDGRSVHAVQIPAALSGFLAFRGAWAQSTALHQTAAATARESGDRPGQASAQGELGVLAWLAADYPAAATSLASAAELYADASDLAGQARALALLGFVQRLTVDCPTATATYERALTLARSTSDRVAEANVLNMLGEVQNMAGDCSAAIASQQLALRLHRESGNGHGQAQALNDLGVIYQETGDHLLSAANQQQALKLFRDLGDRFGQAIALDDLGVLQRESGDYRAADDSHEQALALFRDFGHRLGQAEALNRLGEQSSKTSAARQARDRHAQALTIARDISVPFEEARALEGLGQAHLQDGDPGQAAVYLRQALSIYRRIGVQAAQRVQETLHQHVHTADTVEPGPAPPTETIRKSPPPPPQPTGKPPR